MERPARTRSRTQICFLGGRSFSSDITMPLRLTTACAGSPMQSPPYGVAVRGSIPCRARLVRPGRIRGAGFQPRRKPMRLCPSTACACLAAHWRADLPAQFPPCGVSPKREIADQPPNSNRSYKWRFGEPNQPARRLVRRSPREGGPAKRQPSRKLADSKTERYIRSGSGRKAKENSRRDARVTKGGV
jgi:hypothetical protein